MRKSWKEESGSAIIIVAMALTVIMTAAALVLDIGAAYVDASDAQNAADAIALSVGSYLPIEQNDETAKNEMKCAANEYARKNEIYNFDINTITFGNLVNGKYNSVTICVTKVSTTKIAGIIGVENIILVKSATVSAKAVGAISGAVPIGITEEAFDTAISTGHTTHIVLKVGGGDGENGFYGFIVLDDSNGNAVLLEKWFKYGYEGTNYVGETHMIATGNKTSVARDGVAYRLSLCPHYAGYGGCTIEHFDESCSRIVYILIYKFVDYRTVEVVGFAPFLLEPSSKDDEIQGSFIDINISYADQLSEKNCGTFTYRLTN